MKNIPEILNQILKKRLNEELRLVGSERDTSFTPNKPKSPKLKLSGTDIDPLLEPKTAEWKQAYSPATLEYKVSPYGEFGSRDVIQQLSMPETGKKDSFVKKVMKGSTPAAKFTGRMATQTALGWPFHEAGEQFAQKMGIESPWGQYWTGWAASGAAADVLYPAVTTIPRLIGQGARPAAALAAGGLRAAAALASPLNLAITLGPLAVWGAIEGADAIEEWYKTKDMTPEQKKYYKENKKLLNYIERFNEYEREQEALQRKARERGREIASSMSYKMSNVPDRLPLEPIR